MEFEELEIDEELLEKEHRLDISKKRRLAGAKGGEAKVPKGFATKSTYRKGFKTRKAHGFHRSCFKKH